MKAIDWSQKNFNEIFDTEGNNVVWKIYISDAFKFFYSPEILNKFHVLIQIQISLSHEEHYRQNFLFYHHLQIPQKHMQLGCLQDLS